MARKSLTQEQVDKIQELMAGGMSVRAISAELGIPKSTISDYNQKRLDKISLAADAVVTAVQVIDSMPKKQQDAVFMSAKKSLSMASAHATAGQALANIAALVSTAQHVKASMMSHDELTNPESLAPLMAGVRTVNEALSGSIQIAQLEIKQGLNRSDLDSMSEDELRAELRKLAP